MNIESSLSEWVAEWPTHRQSGQTLCSTSSYLFESVVNLTLTLFAVKTVSVVTTTLGNWTFLNSVTASSYVTAPLIHTLTDTASSVQCKSAAPSVDSAAGVAAAGVAVALAVALGAAVAPAVQNAVDGDANSGQNLNDNQVDAVVAAVAGLAGALAAGIVSNSVPFLVPGDSFTDDLCGDAGARSADGRCLPVLKRGQCPPLHWITVNPQNLSVKFVNFFDFPEIFQIFVGRRRRAAGGCAEEAASSWPATACATTSTTRWNVPEVGASSTRRTATRSATVPSASSPSPHPATGASSCSPADRALPAGWWPSIRPDV